MKISKFLFLLTVLVWGGCQVQNPPQEPAAPAFDSQRAYRDVEKQLSFGPRIPGTEGHRQFVDWISAELDQAGWTVELQQGEGKMGHDLTNILATRGHENGYILMGAHYDTRMYADMDPAPGNRRTPVPGANDGASGVAVLLEIARVLPETLDVPVRLVLFDGEDNGDIPGWDWILGSRMFVSRMEEVPDAVVIVDMVGDKDLDLYREKSSSREIQDQIWEVGQELGYGENFIDHSRYTIIDDHTPFLEKGIPAVDIIDFEYPYWHTTSDTLDKVSPRSLKVVGETLLEWIKGLEAGDIG